MSLVIWILFHIFRSFEVVNRRTRIIYISVNRNWYEPVRYCFCSEQLLRFISYFEWRFSIFFDLSHSLIQGCKLAVSALYCPVPIWAQNLYLLKIKISVPVLSKQVALSHAFVCELLGTLFETLLGDSIVMWTSGTMTIYFKGEQQTVRLLNGTLYSNGNGNGL